MPLLPGSPEAASIDAALRQWRQGDLARDEKWFVHIGDSSNPLTEAATGAQTGGLQTLTTEVEGLVVLTQTCDIVRSCVERPYVEVAPLVEIAPDRLLEVQRGRRPALAALPTLAPSNLVVDLDRVMTVEKSVVAGWTRTPGYASDADARAFARALARKRVRFAFPDDFIRLVANLRTRLTEKHGKQTDEGTGLRTLLEIRVQASPAWDADDVRLFFWFVRGGTQADFSGSSWDSLLEAWLELIPPVGRFKTIEGQVAMLEDMTGLDYVASDRLDLDHLSL